MEDVDVLVVGAGPAGSTAAASLARHGHRVLLVEEHDRVGHPVQCAGLVSERVLELAGSRRFVVGPVRGAEVYGPGRAHLRFQSPTPRAFVIDRAGLDVFLADRAARAGARIETGTKFDRLVGAVNGVAVARLTRAGGEAFDVRTRLVIGADGVASAVARAFRLRRPVEILPAFEAEFPECPADPDSVGVYLGRTIAPGLFGWWIPDGAGGARIGVAATADGTTARSYFDRFCERLRSLHGWRLRSPTSYIVSGIPIGRVPRTSGARVLLVGDAAAQVKPLSGGGIFTGMRCAELAAATAHDALTRDDLGAATLAAYDAAWQKELGAEIDGALYLRRLFLKLTDDELERIVEALGAADLEATIVAFGDIDFPTGVARRLLRQSPSLVRLVPKALSALFGDSGLRAPDLDFGSRRQAR
ncbi:MAG: NAD(P)/FAD-dependent oxidoreductase [Thermoplasmata archaeon]|nr:NAD(P)/FAD-dependent oxidoreductase [Thermoplasmata archaeon]